MSTDIKRMENLIQELNDATRAYDEGKPYMSDHEWDDLYFELLQLEKQFGIAYSDSPTQKVNFQVVSALKKIEHNHPMLSLAKTKSIQEVEAFLGKKDFLAMCKMDGLTCSLRYYNGKLVSAETRGNGVVGEDILHNALVISSIPKYISYKQELVIDGEIICCLDTFSNNFADTYKNARNFAAGSIRLLDSQECYSRHLTFVAWDVITGFDEYHTLEERLSQLDDMNFIVVPWAKGTVEQCIEGIQQLAQENAYPIDGAVFKFNDIEYGKSLGATGHHFRNAIAFKFYDETYPTTLKNIEWTMGRTGVLTPVAVFDPIDIEGSIVERANLHNLSVLRETLHGTEYWSGWKGQQLEVYKANMIIPQIASAQEDDECTKLYLPSYPLYCPICGEKTSIQESSSSLFVVCGNLSCEGKLINQLDHFCGKKGLDIKGISKATLEKLIDWGWVQNRADLFNLKQYRNEWIKAPGFGEKSVDKILNAIQDGTHCEFHQFLAAIGVPLIGTTASKQLANVFNNYSNFRKAIDVKFKFYDLPNFGLEMHNSIVSFNYAEADALVANNIITFKTPEVKPETSESLSGLTFVITGKVTKFKNRDELKNKIEELGGKVSGSVSKNTDYLINNDNKSTSAKNVSAQKLGIPIITEDEFINKFL